MSENKKSRRGTSGEITLELVAQTAIELHRLFSYTGAASDEDLAGRGHEAIKYLSIWARQLEIEKRTGAAEKNAEEVLTHWQADRQEIDRIRETVERETRQISEWATIPLTRQIPFDEAAKMILPEGRNRIIWLERILATMAEESPYETRKRIFRMALENRSVPEGLILHLKASADIIVKRYKSEMAKEAGKVGGRKRAQKYSTSKKPAENDSDKTPSS